jgi:hypothetical protein
MPLKDGWDQWLATLPLFSPNHFISVHGLCCMPLLLSQKKIFIDNNERIGKFNEIFTKTVKANYKLNIDSNLHKKCLEFF